MKSLLIKPNGNGYSCYIKVRCSIFFIRLIPFIKYNGSENAFIYTDISRCVNDLRINYLSPEEKINLNIIQCK